MNEIIGLFYSLLFALILIIGAALLTLIGALLIKLIIKII